MRLRHSVIPSCPNNCQSIGSVHRWTATAILQAMAGSGDAPDRLGYLHSISNVPGSENYSKQLVPAHCAGQLATLYEAAAPHFWRVGTLGLKRV